MDTTPSSYNDTIRLAFDCSVVGVSVALLCGETLYARHDHSGNKQAGQLLPMIDAALSEAGIAYSDVNTLITTHGPGSFTGIRIGLAAAQGILAVHPKRIVVITTLEALALSAARRGYEAFWTCLNAGKGEVYCQLFHVKHGKPEAKTEIALLTPDQFVALCSNNVAIAGNARTLAPLDSLQWIEDVTLPDARNLVYSAAPYCSFDALVPLYIRTPDAKLPAVPLPLE
ncbi:MAG: tRNA (adenosine(37)-N6)-threonylcarbamoyltransferase complex dimerization subunit type 1 TsaB [Alphaproteobacteria bacterium]|nr:tRNA (adenosine(37)-N6)-threonylcarbamoyltransferase complex dimerization subunit type 1 TsaB [Alphaproteobacteria bacterium]